MISQFQVRNYRSIESSEKINLGRLTVLVGPNNEGKSNILRALKVGLGILEGYRPAQAQLHRTQSSSYMRIHRIETYDWENDYPISQQVDHPNRKTSFEIEFKLDNSEIVEFKKIVGTVLNGSLRVNIKIRSSNQPEVRILKQGPSGAKLNAKLDRVCRFISARLAVDYIPAVRSSDDLRRSIDREIERRIFNGDDDPRIKKAREDIIQRYKELLVPYENELLENIKFFVGSAKKVTFDFSEVFSRVIPRTRLMVDDGELTSLEAKGDGIQSLVVLSMKKASLEMDKRRSHVLALEEPEAHLHPGAVRRVAEIISGISKQHQVVITTHSTVLVRRANISHNVIVRENKARVAKNIEDVRESLGVELPDNLISADTVLLVEGNTDVVIIRRLLSCCYPILKRNLANGRLVLESCDGAANVQYSIRRWRDDMCRVHVLLDGDKEGIKAKETIIPRFCSETDVTSVVNARYKSATIEDLLNWRIFNPLIEEKFDVSLSMPDHDFGERCDAFAVRIKRDFMNSGKVYNASLSSSVKKYISEECNNLRNYDDMLNPEFAPMLSGLAKALARKLGVTLEENK